MIRYKNSIRVLLPSDGNNTDHRNRIKGTNPPWYDAYVLTAAGLAYSDSGKSAYYIICSVYLLVLGLTVRYMTIPVRTGEKL